MWTVRMFGFSSKIIWLMTLSDWDDKEREGGKHMETQNLTNKHNKDSNRHKLSQSN